MRLAFTLIGGKDWTGGYNYLLNLLSVLAQYKQDDVTPLLFVGDETALEGIADFVAIPGVQLVRTPLLNVRHRSRSLAQSILLGRNLALSGLFRAHAVDVVFESAQFFGWNLGFPAIAWIPDFQHKAMPELFSRAAVWKRELGFRAQIRGGRTIMLSSDDARHACESYFPSTVGRTKTVHFAIAPGPHIPYAQARAVADSYGLPEHYIFMPNQFWRHKNHRLVLAAVSALRAQGRQVVIAASGKQSDPRDPGYFPSFAHDLAQAGVQDQLRLLGLVPYAHLSLLMRASSALLNASLFEGWSTSVEEARCMGVPMILSDLPVHREQMGDGAQYFDRHSAAALTQALASFQPQAPAERELRASAAREAALLRIQAFADTFFHTATACYQDFHRQ
jgi:glycosyltransferase involved in cell wall biosynthesis